MKCAGNPSLWLLLFVAWLCHFCLVQCQTITSPTIGKRLGVKTSPAALGSMEPVGFVTCCKLGYRSITCEKWIWHFCWTRWSFSFELSGVIIFLKKAGSNYQRQITKECWGAGVAGRNGGFWRWKLGGEHFVKSGNHAIRSFELFGKWKSLFTNARTIGICVMASWN